jgi:hypothetical protein
MLSTTTHGAATSTWATSNESPLDAGVDLHVLGQLRVAVVGRESELGQGNAALERIHQNDLPPLAR